MKRTAMVASILGLLLSVVGVAVYAAPTRILSQPNNADEQVNDARLSANLRLSPSLATTVIVTSTADSGPGAPQWGFQTAVVSDTVAFDGDVFPPDKSQIIRLTRRALRNVTSKERASGATFTPGRALSDNTEILSDRDSGAWRSYTNGNYVEALAVEGDYVWAATDGGAVRWNRNDGTYVKYTTADGLVDNDVDAIAIDGAGHKWFGTVSGVSEFDGSTWTTYTEADGLADNWVTAIAIDGAGHKWFGTNGSGVSEFHGSTWTNHTTTDDLADSHVNAIAIDGGGHKWFGTWWGGRERV